MQKISSLLFLLSLIFFNNNVCAQFADDTEVLHSHTGTGFFGWAVSELQDINDDGITDYIIGSTGSNSTTVYSGAEGDLLFQLSVAGVTVGYAVADAGDVNKDGINDIIAGNPTHNASAGIVAVFSGQNGEVLWRFDGENSGDRLGAAVASAGDINSDGHDDMLIGADSFGNSGRVYVFSGSDGQIIRTLDAESTHDSFGSGVAMLVDIDGDHVTDHIVGAHNAGTNSSGKAYVFSGADGHQIFSLSPDQGGAVFGQFFVADVGDVDHDGVHDIYVGDYNHNSGHGRAYVFSGNTQQILHRFSGNQGEGAGPGRSAGDVDNDGYDDIIVGYYTAGPSQAGLTKVFSGKDGTTLQTFEHNLNSGQLGFDAVGIGDVNGDGRYDFLVSAAQKNTVYVLAGKTDRLNTSPTVFVNPGMNGAWFNPATPGQGIFLDVYPNITSAFMGFFTYDISQNNHPNDAQLGHPNHRWLTAFGPFENNVIRFDVSLTTGGLFDDSTEVSSTPYGIITLTFTDCANAMLEYQFTTIGVNGSIPLTRPAGDNIPLCETLSEQFAQN